LQPTRAERSIAPPTCSPIDRLRALDVFTDDVDETITPPPTEIVDDFTVGFTAVRSVTQSGDRLVSQVQDLRIQQGILLAEISADTKAAAGVKAC
jgi:hypothetical protein